MRRYSFEPPILRFHASASSAEAHISRNRWGRQEDFFSFQNESWVATFEEAVIAQWEADRPAGTLKPPVPYQGYVGQNRSDQHQTHTHFDQLWSRAGE